jgi:hypothetical protein
MVQSCILPLVNGDKDIASPQRKDNKDANEIQKGKELQSDQQLVDKIGQRKPKDDLDQSNQNNKGASRMNDNGNGNDGSGSHGQGHVTCERRIQVDSCKVFVL